MQAIFETIFDVVYLTTVITLGIIIVRRSKGNQEYFLFGIMAITLGLGDSFHLIPRAVALNSSGLEDFAPALGIGKFITSITMTIFYILLYHVWRKRYEIKGQLGSLILIYALAVIRIVLTVLPQNQWTSLNAPVSWGIYRNIPFAIMGLITIYLFYRSAKEENDQPFRWMWLTIVLSFAFYVPVVLWGDTHPLVGILMIPKTLAYVWTIWIGYTDMKNQLKDHTVAKAIS